MTELEFAITKLCGPPIRSNGDGESYWACPKCGREKFHTRPLRPGTKHRFSCWRCGWWGDAADLLQHYFPTEDYGQRLTRLDAMHDEFTEIAHRDQTDETSPTFFYTREQGVPSHHVCVRCKMKDGDFNIQDEEFSPAANHAVADLLTSVGHPQEYPDVPPDSAELRQVLDVAATVLELGARSGLHPLALAGRLRGEIWFRSCSDDHFAECADENCVDAVCCMRARGMTDEEIQDYIESSRAEEAERRERIQRAVNGGRKPVARNGRV